MPVEFDEGRMRSAVGLLDQAVGRLIRQVTLLIEGEAIQVVPKKQDNLMTSITSRFEGEGAATRGVVQAGAPYARFVHEGTGIYGPVGEPYFVHARKAKALAIPTGDGVIYRKWAYIRGMKPRPFFKWAIEKVLPRIQELARAVWDEAFSALGGEAGPP